jgi:uncharacterized protein YndB with AHSA1/START domain
MNRNVVHDTFVIERSYAATPARVFSAFADPSAKMSWFGEPGAEGSPHKIDFRVGGHETLEMDAPDNGPHFTYEAVYQDIVDNERIVYSYDMTMDARRISVSVATLEFLADGGGTHLILTEQGAFLDGLDTNEIRAQGTRELLEALGRFVDGADAP